MTHVRRMETLLLLWTVLLAGCNAAEQTTLPQGWLRIVPPEDVHALALQGGQVWAGGRDGLFLVHRKTGELMELPAGIPPLVYVRDLLVQENGTLLVAHAKGLGSFDGATWTDLSTGLGLPSGPATTLYQAPDGALWVGSEKGACRIQGREFHCLKRGDGLGLDSVDAMLMDPKGHMWFASASQVSGGLSMFDGEKWTHFHKQDVLPHNRVNDLLCDDQGRLHVATGFAESGGVCILQQGTWTVLREEDGLAGAVVRSLYQDQQGHMYYGSEFNGLALFDGKRSLVLRPEDGLAGFEVKEVLQDPQGTLWLATNKGLNRVRSAADLGL